MELAQRRAAQMARAHELEPEFVARLGWDPETLAAYRRRALRELVTLAVARSPWHRKRLHGMDLEALDPDDLRALPTMTKAETMAGWDEIVVDDRLRLADVEEHLTDAADGGYLLGEYTALGTGGSTGRRSVSVFDWDGWAIWWLAFFRRLLAERHTNPAFAGEPISLGMVGAAHPSHASATLARTFNDAGFVNHRFPITLPLAQIVEGLNATRPKLLFGYPSALSLLAREAAEGRLRIAPVQVWAAAEPLLPEIRESCRRAWGSEVRNLWGTTEVGALSTTCSVGRMHLAQDIGIVELLDADGNPTPRGETSAKIYVTSLFNRVFPLIRYEITDELRIHPDGCRCGEPTPTIADVQGRLDDVFVYPQTPVHPHVFRSSLGARAAILEYQVRQTERGADLDVRCADRVDLDALAAELREALAKVGLPDPDVTVRQVERVDRLDYTGKLKRFVPLAASGRGLAATQTQP